MTDMKAFNFIEERLLYFGLAMHQYIDHELPIDWRKVKEYSTLQDFTAIDLEKRFQSNLFNYGYFSLGGLQNSASNYLQAVSRNCSGSVQQYGFIQIPLQTSAKETVFTGSVQPLYNVQLRSVLPNGSLAWNPNNVENLREIIHYGTGRANPKPLAYFNSWEWKEQAEILNLADSRSGGELKEDFIAYVAYHLEEFPRTRYGHLLRADDCDKAAGIAIFHRIIKTVFTKDAPSFRSNWDRTRCEIQNLLAIGAISGTERNTDEWIYWFVDKLFHDPIGPAIFNANDTAFAVLRLTLVNECRYRPWGLIPGLRYLNNCAGLF